MARKQLADGYHISLSLGRELFSEMLAAALPITLKRGSFDLGRELRAAAKRLGVRERVEGLIAERNPPAALVRARDRALSLWDERRQDVARLVDDLVRVEGEWTVELDREGSRFSYRDQRIGAEAFFRFSANGRAVLLRQNVELPFTLSRRLGAELHLGDVHYDRETERLVGRLQDANLHLGEHPLLRLLDELASRLLDERIARFNPVPILKKEHLEGLLGPAMGALKLDMEVEDLALDISEEYLTLRVRFGFSQRQIPEARGARA